MSRFFTRAKSKVAIVTLMCVSLLSGCIEPAPPADPPTQATASRFLHRATFGPSQADIDRLVSLGWEGWMNEQFAKPITDSHFDYYMRGGKPNCDTCDVSDKRAVLSSFWYQAIEGQDQLRQRVAFALSELFVVSLVASSELNDYPEGLMAFHDVLYSNAFGNFRVILDKVSKHPAMGAMLSHKQNDKENPTTGSLPDENYAREIMQLFTIGKWMLNEDGTRKKDANGNDIPAYTQSDIMGMAKAMTGWSWGGADASEERWFGYTISSTGEDPRNFNLAMQPYSNHHSASEKQLANGVVIPAGADPETSMKAALDMLFTHPNTAPFIATHLIKRLVTSNPSPAYVGRVASVFTSNKDGTRGDLRAVVRAILFDPEANDASVIAGTSWGKLREPVIAIANYLRAFNARSGWGTYMINTAEPGEFNYGQNPWFSPTVFNFFMPEHQPLGELSTQNLTAPEFQIFNESTSAGYVNFMAAGVEFGFGSSSNPINPNYSAELALANNTTALVNRVALLLNAGELSASTRAGVEQAVNSITVGSTSWQLRRVRMAITTILASPDYLIQK